jgi:hypothetical protein
MLFERPLSGEPHVPCGSSRVNPPFELIARKRSLEFSDWEAASRQCVLPTHFGQTNFSKAVSQSNPGGELERRKAAIGDLTQSASCRRSALTSRMPSVESTRSLR